jgi:two-component system CheB/CheR fusion protein
MRDDHSPSADDTTASHKVIPLKAGETAPIPLYVGIGASAGGLEAIQTFFQNMPPHSPMAFIVIQHLSPDYKSLMVELLSKKTRIPVQRAEDGMRVEANRIYLIPPKRNLKIFHGKLLLSEQDHSRGINLPIDIFLHSLAEDQGERAAAIILSGTGSDGMRGIRAVKEQGGMVMVQKESSAMFDGMPRAAISTGLADFILAPEEMPGQLNSYVKHPYVSKSDRAHSITEDETGLARIFALLRERHKVDFTFYKPSTVTRRIERRMSVNQIVDINEYARFVTTHPAEVSILYRELLIGVTRFFRDPEAFDRLTDRWLPTLMENPDQHELRLWVAGCSTGEEAYSLAISLRECMEQLGITKDVKIFATDLDREAISKAGSGVYPESIAADISTRMLTKYFYRKEENFHIVRSIREMVVFAQHNLIKDPPFTQIDLVTCRNLLIYLQPVLQRKVLNMINFSLRPGGLLMLGLSETVGELHEIFELVENRYKIFRSLGKSNAILGRNGLPMGDRRLLVDHREQMLGGRRPYRHPEGERTLQRFVDALSGDYIPLSIIVNEHLEVQHLVGDSTGLFRLPSGRPVNDISKMVTKELAIPLSTGIQKVYRSHKPHRFSNIRIQRDGRTQSLRMTIRPLPQKRGQESLVAVIIEEMEAPRHTVEGTETRTYDLDKETEQYMRDMEHELQFTRENLQATIEELETANEELQATNEELLASNEELQSTNEELQSTNEELHTVNVEYQNKIIELTELNNDVENLLSSAQVGKLLLDDNLEIRRFSAGIKDIFKILGSDIGRPLTHLTHRIVNADPLTEVRGVMETKTTVKREIQTEDGLWYLMRIMPYQIGPDAHAGVVLGFVDITELVESRRELEISEDRYHSLFDTISSGVAVYRAVEDGRDFTFVDFNKAAEEIEQIEKAALIGKRLTEVFPGVADFGLLEILREVWRTGEARRHPLTFYQDDRISGWRENQVYKLPSGDLVAVYDDRTAQKETETTLHLAESEKALILDNISEVILHLDLDRNIQWLNPAAAEALGDPPEALVGRPCHTAWCADAADCEDCPFHRAVESGASAQGALTDARGRRWQVQANPVKNAAQELIGVVEVRRPAE